MSRLTLYSDLIPTLDAALAAGGGSITFATQGDAIHWRQRVYKFRKAFARETRSSKYDSLILRRPIDGQVTIEVRQPVGLFTPNEPALEVDAFAVARKLLGE